LKENASGTFGSWALSGVVVKVNQQHVRNKTCNKPSSRFQNSLKSRRHQARIPRQDLQR
jgi:hypothetical protein